MSIYPEHFFDQFKNYIQQLGNIVEINFKHFSIMKRQEYLICASKGRT